MQTLYSITVISPEFFISRAARTVKEMDRTVAICTSLERAKEIVETNENAIYELDGTFVVIESFQSDAIACYGDRTAYWYQWEGPTGFAGLDVPDGYKPCTCPPQYERTVGWVVG